MTLSLYPSLLTLYTAQVCPPLLLPDSVTAAAVSPALVSPGCYLVAAGLDSGAVHLLAWTPGV